MTKHPPYSNALPFLNVLPLDEQKLDIWLLNSLGSELPVQLIARLLKQEDFEIGLDLSLRQSEDKELQEAQNALHQMLKAYQEKGALSLGYPMLLMNDPALDRPIAAPLFIWRVSLEAAVDNNPRHWMLSYDSSSSLLFNELLKNYLIARFNLDWEAIFGAPESLKAQGLLEALARLSQALQLPNPEFPKLFKCPFLQNNAAFNEGVYWSGIMGDFEPDSEELEELPLQLKPRNPRTWYTRAAGLELRPHQQSVLAAIFEAKDVLVVAAEGSGKTRSFAAAVPGLIADAGCTLFVSRQASSFTSLKAELQQAGLSAVELLVLQEEDTGKKALLNQITALPGQLKKIQKPDEKAYHLLLHQFLQVQQQITAAYDALNQQLFGELDWTSTVGQFLAHHRLDKKQFLSRLLNTALFQWSEGEYHEINEQLKHQEALYRPINTLNHPFQQFKQVIFEEQSEKEAQQFIKQALQLLNRKLRDLYQDYSSFIDAYADELRFQYEGFFKALKDKANDILRNLKVYEEIYGNSFENIGSFSNTRLRVMSMFSKRHQQIRRAKEQIYEAYDALIDFFNASPYFAFKLKPVRHYAQLSETAKDLNAFIKTAEEWVQNIPGLLEQKIKELRLGIPLQPTIRRKLEELETRVNQLHEELQGSDFITPSYSFQQEAVAVQREAFLRNLLREMTDIEARLPQFKDFYHWYQHWLDLDPAVQSVVRALVAVRPYSWTTAFRSWYLFHFLDKHYSLQLPEEELPLNSYLELSNDLRKALSSHATWVASARSSATLALFCKEKNIQPQHLRAQLEPLSLKEIVDFLSVEQLSSLFPLIAVTPEMAEQLFPEKLALFDLVVMDDAHLIEPRQGEKLLRLGAQQLVMGEENTKDSLMNLMLKDTEMEQHHFHQQYKGPGAVPFDKSTSRIENSLFRDELYNYLIQYLPESRFDKAVQLKPGLVVDILVHPQEARQSSIAVLADGIMKGREKFDHQNALDQLNELHELGYVVYNAWSLVWWRSPEKTAQELVAFILNQTKA